MSEDEELAALRAKRQAEMEAQAQRQKEEAEMRAQIEAQKQRLLMNILTEEARTRLANIKMANPEFASAIENQLIQLGQTGRLRAKITDDQLKQMLRQLQGKRREKQIRISRK